jgi:hypothetical protein
MDFQISGNALAFGADFVLAALGAVCFSEEYCNGGVTRIPHTKMIASQNGFSLKGISSLSRAFTCAVENPPRNKSSYQALSQERRSTAPPVFHGDPLFTITFKLRPFEWRILSELLIGVKG